MKFFASLLLAVVTPAAYAADSLVRIDCLDETDGAAVYLDGEYQFDCEPFAKRPILTQAGEHEVTVVKPLDREYERVFAQTLELRAGEPQRVRVSLPARTLTAYGREQEALRREQARIAAEKAEQERQERARLAAEAAAREALEQDLALARQGQVAAMQRMAERYDKGDGVEQDPDQASHWREQYRRQQEINRLEASRMEYLDMTKSALMAIYGDDGEPSFTVIMVAPTLVAPTFFAEVLSSPVTTTQNMMVDSDIEALRQQAHATRWANPQALVARVADGH